MSLIKCWECDHEISSAAAACPHCGAPPAVPKHQESPPAIHETVADMLSPNPRMHPKPQPPKVRERIFQTFLNPIHWLGAAVLAGIIALFLISDPPRTSSSSGRHSLPDLTPWYMARQFVQERIEPQRTDFPNPHSKSEFTGMEQLPDGRWRTWGYVDVGGPNNVSRRYWAAEVRPLGGDKWKLETLVFKTDSR